MPLAFRRLRRTLLATRGVATCLVLPGLVLRSLLLGLLFGALVDLMAAAENARGQQSVGDGGATADGDPPPRTHPPAQRDTRSVRLRGNLDRSRARFAGTGQGRVVFMGGSITEMQGYRPMVVQTLRTRFPATKFEFVNAGISSTCSHTGAFRVRRDVLAHQPDLLLVEFAVNDNQDAAHSYNQAVRGMEGIVRTVRRESPQTDIVMLHFVNPEILQAVQRGETPASIAAHEAVAAHYGVPSCNVALELAERIAAGTISWEQYGGVHPGRPGNRLAADLVEQVFDANGFSMGAERPDGVKDKAGTATSEPPPTSSRQDLPPALDPASYVRGRFLDPETVDFGPGWQLRQPDWSKLPGRSRERFAERQLAVSRQPGAELSVRFQGTALGLYVLAGPDAGAVEVSVNDGPWRRWELYHRFSRGLHYPRTVVVASGLKPGQHHVRVRHSRSKHPDSQGSAVRVLEFAVSAAERN